MIPDYDRRLPSLHSEWPCSRRAERTPHRVGPSSRRSLCSWRWHRSRQRCRHHTNHLWVRIHHPDAKLAAANLRAHAPRHIHRGHPRVGCCRWRSRDQDRFCSDNSKRARTLPVGRTPGRTRRAPPIDADVVPGTYRSGRRHTPSVVAAGTVGREQNRSIPSSGLRVHEPDPELAASHPRTGSPRHGGR